MTLIQTLSTGTLKLDGGAMFGVVPKTLWKRLNPPDEDNLCTWDMRILLIRSGDRTILVDTGIGTKQDEKFRSYFHPTGQDRFKLALAAAGVRPEDVTDVLLTHLHFDHVGGAIEKDESGKPQPSFPKATYWSNRKHWDWASRPNAREQASFLQENFLPLQEWGMLAHAETGSMAEWLEGIRLETAYGHTEAMFLPVIPTDRRPVLFCADLIPSMHHIGMPYIMAYDIRPLDTMAEKSRILTWALENEAVLVFEHDPVNEACTLTRDNRGRITVDRAGTLEDCL